MLAWYPPNARVYGRLGARLLGSWTITSQATVNRPKLGTDGRDYFVLSAVLRTVPAQGIMPATCTRHLVATGVGKAKSWRVALPVAPTDGCEDQMVFTTANGRYAVIHGWSGTTSVLIDVAGRSVTEVAGRPWPVGNSIALVNGLNTNYLDTLKQVDILDPASGSRVTVTGEALAAFDTIARSGDFLADASHAWLNDDTAVTLRQGVVRIVNTTTWQVQSQFDAEGPLRQTSRIAVDATSRVLIAEGYHPTYAYSLDSGQQLWTAGDADICAAGEGQVTVSVNGQLANLDAASGKQRAYSADGACGSATVGKYNFLDDGRIRRVLS